MAGINTIGYVRDYSWLFSSPTKKQDSIAKLWNAYGNYQSNATSALAGLSEVSANLKSVLNSYDAAKTTFNTELKENMDALGESAKEVSKYSFSVAKEGAITKTETTDDNGIISTKTTYSKDLQSALDVVSNFVGNYNSSIKFFSDNAAISKRVENMGKIFDDVSYRAATYESIGLTVGTGGTLEINEEILANAIVNNPERVSSLLGSDGLAGKAESHVSFANSQADKLFPTAQSMLGNQIETASIYTGKAYLNMNYFNNVGSLVNMLF